MFPCKSKTKQRKNCLGIYKGFPVLTKGESSLGIWTSWVLYIYKCCFIHTPRKINMEPKNHPIEKEHHLNRTSIFVFQPFIFQGVSKSASPFTQCPVTGRTEVQVSHERIPLTFDYTGCLIGILKTFIIIPIKLGSFSSPI